MLWNTTKERQLVNAKFLVQPGDILAVRTNGIPGWWIRFGSALRNQPNLDNHIAVVHHQNVDGTWRCIEARPGGVAWADATPYLNSPYTVNNIGQPKTPAQRAIVCKVVEQMLGTSYDWDAIAQDALMDLRIPDVWAEKWNGKTPDHVVCSSLAAWAYGKAQLAEPKTADPAHIEPSDWTQFSLVNHYNIS